MCGSGNSKSGEDGFPAGGLQDCSEGRTKPKPRAFFIPESIAVCFFFGSPGFKVFGSDDHMVVRICGQFFELYVERILFCKLRVR